MMKHTHLRRVTGLLVGLILLLVTCLPAMVQAQALTDLTDLTDLSIETAGGERRFSVELADNVASRRRGLMFRESMPLDHGMIFDFKRQQHLSFWMKNTPLPLDIIFIDRQGVIVHIHHNAIPHDETPIPSIQPATAVLEVNGGVARLTGIARGDLVRHAIFGNRAD